VAYEPALPHRYGSVDYGLYRVVATDLPASTGAVALEPRIRSFFEAVLDRGTPADLSQRLHYREFTSGYCRLVAALVEHDSDTAGSLADSLESRCNDYQGLLQRAAVALAAIPPDPARALKLLSRAAGYADEAVTFDNRAQLDYLFGRAYLLSGDRRNAAMHFAASLSIWPGEENPAFQFAVAAPR
jgi:hypothetical protein